jgi:hypothetical protein
VFASVPEIVYTVVEPGCAVTELLDVELSPVPGDHVKEVTPLAVSVVESPAQIEALFTIMVGRLFTVTVDVAVLLQLFASFPVTVYTMVLLGVAVVVPPVVEFNDVEGVHE